ncbi:unnamed protein product [Sphenostylis stenocarpa]|uniref:Uncharacterized protein n=1 Tax=Sphenostylis stenocarpa TaxID=92480 RepID=A0AA86S8Q3_9FABA|nr:unnamed protein product [Sphenostylis stenocarpa]
MVPNLALTLSNHLVNKGFLDGGPVRYTLETRFRKSILTSGRCTRAGSFERVRGESSSATGKNGAPKAKPTPQQYNELIPVFQQSFWKLPPSKAGSKPSVVNLRARGISSSLPVEERRGLAP